MNLKKSVKKIKKQKLERERDREKYEVGRGDEKNEIL